MDEEFRPLSFNRFIEAQAEALRRIASKTRGSHDVDDLRSEAWLIAIEIGKRAGASIDLAHPANQSTVLAWLYKRFVDYVDGKLKESIDQASDDVSWHERLAAPPEADPLAQLLRSDAEAAELPTKGFSQFTAYMILLKRCELSFMRLAAYLDISFPTLQRRVDEASEHADYQPSIFDGVETIPSSFEPRSRIIRQLQEEHGLHALAAWVSGAAAKLVDVSRQLAFLFLPTSRQT